jgi:2,3-bisphosphoglycerate-independent phosphoglycerate mutase
MSSNLSTPMVVIVRDGWGRNPHPEQDEYNAIKLARTPRADALLDEYPWTLIHTSGEDVGLPDGTMGNSEVGHQNIGAGRVVYQDSVRITKAVREGEFFQNTVLLKAVDRAKATGGTVHLLGLASDVGVHALLGHLYACVELCARNGVTKVAIHCFTDGRDSGPYSGKGYLADIEARCADIGVGKIASVCGRYFAMDRDNRWERVSQAYDMLTGRAEAKNFDTVDQAVQSYYDNPTNDSQNGDEFITPRTIGDAKATRIVDGDSIIFFNFRGDRPREISRAFVMDQFEGHVKASPDTGVKGFDRGA